MAASFKTWFEGTGLDMAQLVESLAHSCADTLPRIGFTDYEVDLGSIFV